jgi:hypothetical protein
VYSTSAEIKAQVGMRAAQDIKNPSRIYFKDGFLFINENGEGIHIIDNRDPAHPIKKSFLNIPGNYDLAIRNNTLYADSYVDLVAFDISDFANIREVARKEGMFNHYNSLGMFMQEGKGFVTDWKKVTNHSVSVNSCMDGVQPEAMFYRDGIAMTNVRAASFDSKAAVSPVSATGKGGSMARFTIKGDYLYALDDYFLDVVKVSSATPVSITEISLNWDPETLFPFEESLFIGTRTGMFIYDLTQPEKPELLSTFEHVSSCDPVVVEGDYAYVTLYDGNECQNFTNQLEVVDISNLRKPSLTKVYPFTNPHGLAIDNGILFICDGADGLKIYDAKNVNTITDKQLAHYKNIQPLDLIAFNNVAMVIGQDGLYQYDYSDIKNIKLLSTIVLVRE